MKSELEEIEQERLNIKKKLIPIYIISGIVGAISIAFLFFQFIIGIFGLVIVFTFTFGAIRKNTGKYSTIIKEKVITKIINFVNNDLKYYPNNCISQSEYLGGQIFNNKPDVYKGEDLITGKIDKTDIRFSELHTQDKRTDSDGKTHYVTLFKGIFFIADFHKNFNGETLVLSDIAEKTFGSWLGNKFQSWNKARGDLVKLENPEFEKEFVVYSTDQIEARYILTLTMMERIMNFKKHTGQKLEISFINNNIYMAISYTENLFYVSINKSVLDFDVIKKYYSDLTFALSIVDELNLNTRIWNRE